MSANQKYWLCTLIIVCVFTLCLAAMFAPASQR